MKARKYELDEYVMDESILKKKSRHLQRERDMIQQELQNLKKEKALSVIIFADLLEEHAETVGQVR